MGAITTETLTVFKARALALANRPSQPSTAAFAASDIDQAYEFATQACGFEFPASTDAEFSAKRAGLWNRVMLFVAEALRMSYVLNFDIDKGKASQIAAAIKTTIDGLNKDWEDMRVERAHVFKSVSDVFPSNMVLKTGFYQDRFGGDASYSKETVTTRTKSPEATTNLLGT